MGNEFLNSSNVEGYINNENIKPDYNTNAGSYYKDLARKAGLIELLSKKIWEYDEELAKRFDEWDKNLEEFDESVITLLEEWIDDGTFAHIINEEIFAINSQRLDEVAINVKKYGAIGDGVTDDSDAIQYVLDTYKRAYIPSGNFLTTKPLQLKYDNMVIKGAGLSSAIVGNNKSFPILEVTSERFSNLVMEDIIIREGNYGLIKETSGIMERSHLENVWFEFQSVAGMSIKAPAQYMVNNLVDVVFRYSTGGIFLSGGASNLNTYTRVRFEGLDAPSFRMSNVTPNSTELGGSVNLFNGCRFEAHNHDITGYYPIEILNGDFNTKFDGCYFEDIITPCIYVDTFPQNSRLFHVTDCHFSGNTPKGSLIKFSAGIRGATIENSHLANDGGSGIIEGSSQSSDVCIQNNQYLDSVIGFNDDAFTYNDIGKKINKDILLFDRKYFHATRSGLKITDAIGVSTYETDDQGSLSLRPLGVERAKIMKDGNIELMTSGKGVRLISPNGTKFLLTVTDAGAMNITQQV